MNPTRKKVRLQSFCDYLFFNTDIAFLLFFLNKRKTFYAGSGKEKKESEPGGDDARLALL